MSERRGPDISAELDRHFLIIHVVKETLSDRKRSTAAPEIPTTAIGTEDLPNCVQAYIKPSGSEKQERPNNKRRKTNIRRQIQST